MPRSISSRIERDGSIYGWRPGSIRHRVDGRARYRPTEEDDQRLLAYITADIRSRPDMSTYWLRPSPRRELVERLRARAARNEAAREQILAAAKAEAAKNPRPLVLGRSKREKPSRAVSARPKRAASLRWSEDEESVALDLDLTATAAAAKLPQRTAAAVKLLRTKRYSAEQRREAIERQPSTKACDQCGVDIPRGRHSDRCKQCVTYECGWCEKSFGLRDKGRVRTNYCSLDCYFAHKRYGMDTVPTPL